MRCLLSAVGIAFLLLSSVAAPAAEVTPRQALEHATRAVWKAFDQPEVQSLEEMVATAGLALDESAKCTNEARLDEERIAERRALLSGRSHYTFIFDPEAHRVLFGWMICVYVDKSSGQVIGITLQ
jgi:hypothetical protein